MEYKSDRNFITYRLRHKIAYAMFNLTYTYTDIYYVERIIIKKILGKSWTGDRILNRFSVPTASVTDWLFMHMQRCNTYPINGTDEKVKLLLTDLQDI